MNILDNIPRHVEIISPSLGAIVEFDGYSFFLNGGQTDLTKVEINTLHSEVMFQETQSFNEFNKGCFYDL
ncbi:hypothetical protein OAH77_04545 [Flavobacteriaceae bacterium]|nr:hypothetical protein [Flavobacteriaceae bacterium]